MNTFALVSLGVLVAAAVAVVMEPWARLLHGRVWHHVLFRVHRSHHAHRKGRFEANDVLSAAHAPIAAALIVIGCNMHGAWAAVAIGVGAGMTVFGLAYVVVHDGLVHGRLPVAFLRRSRWLRRVRDAHRVHHARGEAPYGFFFGPLELMRTPRARGERPIAPPPLGLARVEPRDTRSGAARRSA